MTTTRSSYRETFGEAAMEESDSPWFQFIVRAMKRGAEFYWESDSGTLIARYFMVYKGKEYELAKNYLDHSLDRILK